MSANISPVVSTNWLADRLSAHPRNFIVLDGSLQPPITKRESRMEFLMEHIPTAQFFDIDDCRDKSTDVAHMLPSPEEFSLYVGNLGIGNKTHVVIYDNDDMFGMLTAQRVWWTFRVFGHDRVSVLDGGLPKWKKDGYRLTNIVGKIEKKQFKSEFRPEMVTTFDEIVSNLETKEFTVVDTRSPGRYEGTAPEPNPAIKSGHIPGSINVPFVLMLNPDTKTLKSPNEMMEVFEQRGIDTDKPLTSTCGSGVTACMLVLAYHLMGKNSITVYDGAWMEWFLRAKKEHILTKA